MSDFNLQAHGINVTDIVRNAPASSFSEEAIRGGQVATISNRGALIAYSGRKTGRSPATNGSSNTRNRSHTGLRRRHFEALLPEFAIHRQIRGPDRQSGGNGQFTGRVCGIGRDE